MLDGSLQSIIDLLIPGRTPGIKEQIVDLYNRPELLFFGPDGGCLTMIPRHSIFTLSYQCRGYSRYDGLGSLYVLVSWVAAFLFKNFNTEAYLQ
jgi:hypothetical protein